jgi:hypothetical protein
MRTLLRLLPAVALAGLLLTGCGLGTRGKPAGSRAGKPAPEIEGTDLDGKSFKLSDYRGKVVLLDFWGHW